MEMEFFYFLQDLSADDALLERRLAKQHTSSETRLLLGSSRFRKLF